MEKEYYELKIFCKNCGYGRKERLWEKVQAGNDILSNVLFSEETAKAIEDLKKIKIEKGKELKEISCPACQCKTLERV